MDAVSAFSLVCGIIQIVDFSAKAVKKCQELYKNGVSLENKEIEEMAKNLIDLRRTLDLKDQDDAEGIFNLGSKCSSTAEELVTELERLKVKGPHRKRQVARNTLKSMFKGSNIDHLQNRLDEYQKQLDSKILVDLRNRYHSTALLEDKKFHEFNRNFQTILLEIAQSHRNFNELKSLIQSEGLSIRGHITNELQHHRDGQKNELYRREFCNSLFFSEMHRRQETVGEAHQKTFQWIFEPDEFDSSACRWDSFVQWLEQGDGIYWINGKAGSGKSTLMNYRWRRLLKAYYGHYSIRFCRDFLKLDPFTLDKQSAVEPAKDSQPKFEPIAAWTERRLRTFFQKVMLQVQENCRVCIFIDGLDETTDDSDAVIAMVESMLSPNAKLCVSSRPDRWCADAFGSSPKLRLQDLTERDIRVYASDKLQPFLQHDSKYEVSHFLDSVVEKAQGVFLWVRLVVAALIHGLRNDDSLEQLQLRVESLPSDMEALYARMLNNIDAIYRKEAGQLFQMALANLTRSLLDVTLALCNAFEHISEMSIQEAIRLSLRNENRIPAVSAGLLEVQLEDKDSRKGGGQFDFDDSYVTLPYRYASSAKVAEVSYHERYVHVSFIHRTAIDFLRHSRPGKIFLEENTNSCPSPHSVYIRALLPKVTLLGFPEKPENTDNEFDREAFLPVSFVLNDWCDNFADQIAIAFVHNIMKNLILEEFRTGSAHIELCNDVDHTLATLYQQHLVMPPLSHWCTPWRMLVPETGKRLRSSSSTSLCLANNEPCLFSSGPVDYLGLAASWGLTSYVLGMLDSQRILQDNKYMNYLLCCSVRGLYRIVPWCQVVNWVIALSNLVSQLLSLGTNPNVYVDELSTTIWGLFLKVKGCWAYEKAPAAFVNVAKAFVEAGADVQMRTLDQFPLRARLRIPGSEPHASRSIYFYLETSALYNIRKVLRSKPLWKTVEDIIQAKGGRESHRFTHAAIYINDDRRCKISKKLHENLIKAATIAYDAYLKKPQDGYWFNLLEKTCFEHLTSTEFTDNHITSDDGDSSNTDSDEEFSESLEIQPPTEDLEDINHVGDEEAPAT